MAASRTELTKSTDHPSEVRWGDSELEPCVGCHDLAGQALSFSGSVHLWHLPEPKKVCKMRAFWDILQGFGILFYVP